MEQALRAVTVARGVDPRSCALVAFGGAGPLHAAALAGVMGMRRVIVPARAGVLSAVGVLASPMQRDLVRSWPTPADHAGVEAALRSLGDDAARLVRQAGASADGAVDVDLALDCRYAGQSHELTVATITDFHEAHRRRNGYARMDAAIEVVALRATARRAAVVRVDDLPSPARREAVGPAVIAEDDCTVWVPHGWRARRGAAGALVLERTP
jgi:N-methylhydantoinase A/oxoprolinase/acetone carboxylase beta subunit